MKKKFIENINTLTQNFFFIIMMISVIIRVLIIGTKYGDYSRTLTIRWKSWIKIYKYFLFLFVFLFYFKNNISIIISKIRRLYTAKIYTTHKYLSWHNFHSIQQTVSEFYMWTKAISIKIAFSICGRKMEWFLLSFFLC